MSAEFIDYIAEQLRPLGNLRSKRMFGGVGIYIDGLFCAFVADEMLYFKADALSVEKFQKAGCKPFTYAKDGVEHAMQYYRIPDQALDSADELIGWARLGMEAALRKASRPATPKKRSRKVPD